MPPSSQGYLTLLALRIAAQLGLPDDAEDPEWCHLLVESARAAGHDRPTVLHEHADPASLLHPDLIGERASRIRRDRRTALPPVPAGAGDTIYLCAVDRERMGVSLIQSNCADFGSHLIEPTTGVFLHNRGVGFSVEPGHPAEYGPGRRPPSTLSPALVTARGEMRACVGTMGGDVQPQVVLQLVTRLLQLGQSPGAIQRAPRWVLRDRRSTGFSLWRGAGPASVGVEPHAPESWRTGLVARGHEVDVLDPRAPGTGHANLIENRGPVLAGAAEPRAGGAAAAL
jgi:gamma-glutamyltranspeptidase/glutathione hydrolase